MIKMISLLIVFVFVTGMVTGQPGAEKEVAAGIESLKKAMLSVDEAALNTLTADQLSYGHSSGLVEDKKEFIRKMTSRENVYTDIRLSHQVITISGDVAICRNQSEIYTNDDNKPALLRLLVMMVWQKQSGQWKLLARQSVRMPEPK